MWFWLKFGSKTKILNTRSTPTADAQKPGEKTASKNVELAKADEGGSGGSEAGGESEGKAPEAGAGLLRRDRAAAGARPSQAIYELEPEEETPLHKF